MAEQEQKEDLDNDGDSPGDKYLDLPDLDDETNTVRLPKKQSIVQKRNEELDAPDLDDDTHLQSSANTRKLSKA